MIQQTETLKQQMRIPRNVVPFTCWDSSFADQGGFEPQIGCPSQSMGLWSCLPFLKLGSLDCNRSLGLTQRPQETTMSMNVQLILALWTNHLCNQISQTCFMQSRRIHPAAYVSLKHPWSFGQGSTSDLQVGASFQHGFCMSLLSSSD